MKAHHYSQWTTAAHFNVKKTYIHHWQSPLISCQPHQWQLTTKIGYYPWLSKLQHLTIMIGEPLEQPITTANEQPILTFDKRPWPLMTMITKWLPMLATMINDQPQVPTKRDNQDKIITIICHIALPPLCTPATTANRWQLGAQTSRELIPSIDEQFWYTHWAKRLSGHFCVYNSVTSSSFWISLQGIITQCSLPILSILWGLSLSLSCCEGGYKKLVDFQIVKMVRFYWSFWPKNAYFRLKMAKMTCLKCEFLMNVWIFFYDSKCNLLRKGSTFILLKRFNKICPFFTTWKSTNFIYPPSQQKRERDNPHKILKIGSLHWVIIPCNEIQKLGLVTELYMQKWSDNLFAQWA